MTIETNLNRIADALEKIVLVMTAEVTISDVKVTAPKKPAQKKKVAAVEAAPEVASTPAPVTPVAKVPTPPAPVAPTVTATPVADVPTPPASVETTVIMTAEELNAQLGKEFHRLGNSDVGIRAAIAEMGVAGVSDLPSVKYAELLAKVRAL